MFGHDNTSDEQPQSTVAPQAPALDNQVAAATGFVETPSHTATPAAASPSHAATDDLLDIKQQALQALTPLVGQLDQTPEEQFRTTMMMIQASDNHSLVHIAYEAAQKIANEKDRAQALLDIVNEINYFTQQS